MPAHLEKGSEKVNVEELIDRLVWLGHDSFRLDGPPVVYFDPWKLKATAIQGAERQADLVLVSHEHSDHCSPEDIKDISSPHTQVVCSHGAAEKLPQARVIHPGENITIQGIEVEAVRAYNINKWRSPGIPFHPKESDMVGYIVTVGGLRLYFAGDTDHIPEMADIDCDVALLPVSGHYVMTAAEAADAARTIQPQVVIPMHFGSGIGTEDDGHTFSGLYSGRVLVLERGG